MRLGYACLNITLGEFGGFKTAKKQTFLEKGLSYVGDLCLVNLERLKTILEWNSINHIGLYRMSSSMVPWASEYKLQELPQFEKIQSKLTEIGNFAKSNSMRLTYHPGQFNVLSSNNENVILNSIRDLEHHAEMMDLMGLEKTHFSKINIHVGGVFGNKNEALERWRKNFERLSASVQSRLTVENDDKVNCYSVKDLYDGIYKFVGTPIVYDQHHHIIGANSQKLSCDEAIQMASETWPAGITQVCHLSNSASEFEEKDTGLQAHSDYIYRPFINNNKLEIDLIIEAKKKELALMDYTSKFL